MKQLSDLDKLIKNNGNLKMDDLKLEFDENMNLKENSNSKTLQDKIKEKWSIGSDKSNINDEEMNNLKDLAKMLQDNSPNGWKYTVEKTYEDFGAGMQWHTIICYDDKGNDWQILNTKEWLDLMNTGDIETIYNEIVNGRYFQDKEQKGKIDLWKWDI